MIEIRGLKKAFDKPVLTGVDLVIEDNQTMAIIGPSGCGKSVLLKHLVGLLRADEGHVIVDGEDLATFSESDFYDLRIKFGMLFQSAALLASLTIGENVGLWLKEHTHTPAGQIRERAEAILHLVGLHGVMDKSPAELSGGMKKRAGLARSIIHEPKYVLYDEPTTGLDPIMSDIINDLILRVRSKQKNTAIVVTHDMNSVYKVADQVAMLHEGKIVFQGTPDELRNTENPLARQFIEGKARGPIHL